MPHLIIGPRHVFIEHDLGKILVEIGFHKEFEKKNEKKKKNPVSIWTHFPM